MRKFLNYLLILTLVPTLLLTSCKDDDDTTPDEPKGTFADLKNYMVANDMDLPALLDGWVIAPKMIADGGIVADDYTIPDYENPEVTGDGLDNDCDGVVDNVSPVLPNIWINEIQTNRPQNG